MKSKITYILIGIFFILVIGIVTQRAIEKRIESQLIQQKRLVDIKNPNDINIIEVKEGDKYFTLAKKGETWMIGEYEALPSFVDNLFTAIENAEVVSVVSNTLDSRSQFALDEKAARTFIFKNNDIVVGQFTAGTQDVRPQTYYAIKQGENKIYHVAGLFGNFFQDELRNSQVETVDREKITQVTIQMDKKTVEIVKQNDFWTVNGRRAKLEKIEDFLNRVVRINADTFLKSDEKPKDFDTKIVIKTQDATTTVEIGPKDSRESYYIKNSKGVMYGITNTTREQLVKDASYFIK